MYTYDFDNINDALCILCHDVLTRGQEMTVRGSVVKELHPVVIEFTNPKARTLLFPGRGDDPFARLAETAWVLGSPDNDITYLLNWLPRAKDYSDNPESNRPTWRAGYPERLRMYGKAPGIYGGVDQLRYVYDQLKADPNSRQAVAVLWNPMEDDFDLGGRELLVTKDKCCSNLLNFIIRDGKLDLTFYMRSNDLIFGMTGINFYEFSVIQELMAGALGVEVGTLYYIANSLQVYERHYEKAKQLALSLMTIEHNPWDPQVIGEMPEFKMCDDSTSWGMVEEKWRALFDSVNKFLSVGGMPDYIPANVCVDDPAKNIYNLLVMRRRWETRKVDKASPSYVYAQSQECLTELTKIGKSYLGLSCLFWLLKDMKIIEPHDLKSAAQMYNKLF